MSELGRNVDARLGTLSGEGAQMRVDRPEIANALARHAPGQVPAVRPPAVEAESPTYYDLPVVKAPPWVGYIPAYFYFGGLSGASAVLAGALQVAGRPEHDAVLVRARWVSAAAIQIGAGLLIADLGRPERFLHMLRVFRPSSPLNVGTWIISFSGVTSAAAAASTLPIARRWPVVRRIGDAAGLAAAPSGALLSTYTAVVLVNTAMPFWSSLRITLPPLFACSAAASAAALLQALGPRDPASRLLARASVAAELGVAVGMHLLEREVGDGRAGAPLRSGRTGALWKAAKVLGLATLALAALPTHRPGKRVAVGVLGTAAALAVRFAIHESGMASAKDPRATFEPQRAALAG